MKKLIVFLFLLCAMSSTAFFKFDKNPLFSLDGVQQVCFVSNSEIQNERVSCVHCGDLVFNYCSLATAKANLKEFQKNVKAVQFYFSEVDVDQLISTLKATIVSETEVEGMTVIMAYTPYYSDSVLVDGKKVNLQIACKEKQVIAGFPAILTGF